MAARPTFGQLAGRLLQQQRARAGFGGSGGSSGGGSGGTSPAGVFGGSAGILLLVAGGYAVNSAMFNGASRLERFRGVPRSLTEKRPGVGQSMVGIARSSTRGFMVSVRRCTLRAPTCW